MIAKAHNVDLLFYVLKTDIKVMHIGFSVVWAFGRLGFGRLGCNLRNNTNVHNKKLNWYTAFRTWHLNICILVFNIC